MSAIPVSETSSFGGDDPLFARIAEDLRARSFSVHHNAVPAPLSEALFAQIQSFNQSQFTPAGVGRDQAHTINQMVRRDAIRWITGQTAAEQQWLQWNENLRDFLNRELYLGLFTFESHFAHYSAGDFYRRHVDAFKADRLTQKANRIISVVAYFNPGWLPDNGGELLIYDETGLQPILKVTPNYATLVVFLSDAVPHEVLSTKRDRYSIAGWFRSN